MATVNGYTAEHTDEVFNQSITGATIRADGHLIVVTRGGTAIDAGNATGPMGPVGTVPDATTTVKGKVALATNDQAAAGTDTTLAITPAALANMVYSAIGYALPVGITLDYAGSSVPGGYLACSGQAVSRTTYANLFAAIGTLHGAGDGSTTFNVPDSRGRTSVGVSSSDTDFATVGKTGGVKTASHTHPLSNAGGALFNYNTSTMFATRDVVSPAWLPQNQGSAQWQGYAGGATTVGNGIALHGFTDAQVISLVQPYIAFTKIIKY